MKTLISEQGRKITAARAGIKRKGKGRYWRLVVQHRSQGQRAAQPDKQGGQVREQKDKVKAWLKNEEQRGHEPAAEDLLDQFHLELEDLIFHLEAEEPQWQLWQLHFEGDELKEESKEKIKEISTKREQLKAARGIIAKGFQSKQGRGYHQQQLLMWCEKIRRKPDLVFPMTEAEGSS